MTRNLSSYSITLIIWVFPFEPSISKSVHWVPGPLHLEEPLWHICVLIMANSMLSLGRTSILFLLWIIFSMSLMVLLSSPRFNCMVHITCSESRKVMKIWHASELNMAVLSTWLWQLGSEMLRLFSESCQWYFPRSAWCLCCGWFGWQYGLFQIWGRTCHSCVHRSFQTQSQ